MIDHLVLKVEWGSKDKSVIDELDIFFQKIEQIEAAQQKVQIRPVFLFYYYTQLLQWQPLKNESNVERRAILPARDFTGKICISFAYWRLLIAAGTVHVDSVERHYKRHEPGNSFLHPEKRFSYKSWKRWAFVCMHAFG